MSRRWGAAVWLLFALGLLVRVLYLDVPLLDFHPARQYRSALIARGRSEVALRAFSPDGVIAARRMARMQDVIEPEVMEAAAVTAYRLLGREDLRAPRLLSILAWIGGVLSIAWMLRLAGTPGLPAVAAVSFALFAPFGVAGSRAFMPDPLMTGLTMAALGCAFRHHLRPAAAWAVARVVVAGMAIYVKPMAGVFIAPAMLALDVARLGLWRGVATAAVTVAIAAVPAGMHYASLVATGNPVAENRFFPQLLLRAEFWDRWMSRIREVIGLPALAVAAVGVVLGRGDLRRLIAGAWAGYIIMGMLFTHHISTHDYYSLPLVPLAGASLALGIGAILRWFPHRTHVVTAVVAAAVVVGLRPSFAGHGYYGDIDRVRQAAADYERIGELTYHSPRVVSLDESYGFALAYHARVVTLQLPLSGDRAIEDLTGERERSAVDGLLAFRGEYFVGTIQRELDLQPDLRDYLERHYPLVDRGGVPGQWRYVVYDLTQPIRPPDHPDVQ